MSAGTVSNAPVAPNWPIMSVPIWLTSGVVLPAIAVWSFATASSQATGVTLTLTFGFSAMNASASVPSFVPSAPIAQTVSSPLSSAAGPAEPGATEPPVPADEEAAPVVPSPPPPPAPPPPGPPAGPADPRATEPPVPADEAAAPVVPSTPPEPEPLFVPHAAAPNTNNNEPARADARERKRMSLDPPSAEGWTHRLRSPSL